MGKHDPMEGGVRTTIHAPKNRRSHNREHACRNFFTRKFDEKCSFPLHCLPTAIGKKVPLHGETCVVVVKTKPNYAAEHTKLLGFHIAAHTGRRTRCNRDFGWRRVQ